MTFVNFSHEEFFSVVHFEFEIVAAINHACCDSPVIEIKYGA